MPGRACARKRNSATLIAFFRARRGAARGFRLRDPFDFSSNGMTGTPTQLDQVIGTGDGLDRSFRWSSTMASGTRRRSAPITRPVAATPCVVSVDGVADERLDARGEAA